MKSQYKFGLIVGVIGLVLNICVAGFMGLCGPLVSLLAGGVAGFFAAQQEKVATKGNGAQLGAVAGTIAGALVLIGQVIGGLVALLLVQYAGLKVPFGQVPSFQSDPSQLVAYYLSGLGAGLCFGLLGVVLAALAGAGLGYLGTPSQPEIMQL